MDCRKLDNMGNQQSTANHNRLSKPKTNTNSPSLGLKVDSPVSVASRYADLSAKGRQQIRESLLSPAHTEFGSAIWSNKDDGMVETATHTRGRPLSVISRSNSRANSRINSRSNSLSCFGSRHGSSTKLAGLGDSQVDLEAAIKLLQEVKRNASPEDAAALRKCPRVLVACMAHHKATVHVHRPQPSSFIIQSSPQNTVHFHAS